MYSQKLIGKTLSIFMSIMAILAIIFKEIYAFKLSFSLSIALISIWELWESKNNGQFKILKNTFYILFPIISIYCILS